MPSPIEIIHATDRYAVIAKAAGLLSVPGKGPDKQRCAASLVAAQFPGSSGPLVVHRLDMDTSGLMVFGLDADSQRELSAQFEGRTVEKAYTAVVCGHVTGESGRIDAPMRLDVERRPLQVIDHELGRSASTVWKLLSFEADGSRLELTPITGRTHQLRLHMAHVGFAIMGDVLYGPQPETAGRSDRLLLHASGLSFHEPGGGPRVEFRSSPGF